MNDFYVDEDGIVRNRAEEEAKKSEELLKEEEKEKEALIQKENEEKLKKEEELKKLKEKEETEKKQKEEERIKEEERKKQEKLSHPNKEQNKLLIKTLCLIIIIMVITLFIFSIKTKTQRLKDTDANLKEILINDQKLSNFDKTVNYYEVYLDREDVNIKCVSSSKKAKISGCVSQKVSLGEELELNIIVTSEYGISKTYTLNLINEKAKSVKIDEIIGLPEKYVANNVTITIKASGLLAGKPYSFDGGTTWQTSPSFTFDSKKNVLVRVKGIDGDIAGQNVIIKIDKTKPVVKLSSIQGRVVEAIVNPATPASSYFYLWYINDKLIPEYTGKTVTIRDKGTYKVIVKTAAGLSASASINVY